MNIVSETSVSPLRVDAGHDHAEPIEGAQRLPVGTRIAVFCEAPERYRWLHDCLQRDLPGVDIVSASGSEWAPEDAAAELCVIDEGIEGMQRLKRLRAASYAGKVIVISPCGGQQKIVDVLAAGADGVVCRMDPPAEIARALYEVSTGCPGLSASAVRALIAHVRGAQPAIVSEYSLTAREREIIALANKGYTFPQTAALIGVRVSTVYTHVRRLYEKMSVNSLPQALFEARRAGLL